MPQKYWEVSKCTALHLVASKGYKVFFFVRHKLERRLPFLLCHISFYSLMCCAEKVVSCDIFIIIFTLSLFPETYFVFVPALPLLFPFSSSKSLYFSWHPTSDGKVGGLWVVQRSQKTNPRGNVRGTKGNLWNPSPLAHSAVFAPHVKIPLPLPVLFNANIKHGGPRKHRFASKSAELARNKKGLRQLAETAGPSLDIYGLVIRVPWGAHLGTNTLPSGLYNCTSVNNKSYQSLGKLKCPPYWKAPKQNTKIRHESENSQWPVDLCSPTVLIVTDTQLCAQAALNMESLKHCSQHVS